jgi:hypothetical protein
VLWRVVLLIGVLVAVLLGGAAVWQDQRPHESCRHVRISGEQVEVEGSCRETQARHHAQALGYAAAGVAVVTLASMPLLRLRDRR